MSDDLMLHGVLNMPLPDNPTECDLVTWVQFKARAREASGRIEALTAELAKAIAERDEWQHMVGGIAATVPLRKTLSATATLGDLVQYFKDLHARAEAAEAREHDAFERGFKAALEEASEVADEHDYDLGPYSETTLAGVVAEAIRAIPLPTETTNPTQEGDGQ